MRDQNLDNFPQFHEEFKVDVGLFVRLLRRGRRGLVSKVSDSLSSKSSKTTTKNRFNLFLLPKAMFLPIKMGD